MVSIVDMSMLPYVNGATNDTVDGQDMARALVTVEDVNVVIVDWRGGSLPLYSQAAANTRSQEC